MAEIKRRIPQGDTGIVPTTPIQGAGMQTGLAEVGRGLAANTREQVKRLKRLDSINNDTWLLDTTNEMQREAREVYAGLTSLTGRDAENAMEKSKEFTDKWEGRLSAEAPNDIYKNQAMQFSSRLFNSYEDKLIIHQVQETEAGVNRAWGDRIDEVAEDVYTSGGGVEALDASIALLFGPDDDMYTKYRADFGSDKADKLEEAGTKHIANNLIDRSMRLDAEGTLNDLEAGKYSEYITTKERDAHIKNARAEAKYQKNQAREVQIEAQDDILADIIKTPTIEAVQTAKEALPFKDDAKGQSALAQIENSLITTAKKEARAQAYVNTMTTLNAPGVDPREVSDAELMNLAGGNLEDFTKLKSYQKDILLNPTKDRASYQLTLDDMEADYKAGLYGDFGSEDALIEYAEQQESLRLWTLKNPDRNPLEYQKEIKRNKSITGFQNFLNAVPVFNLFYEPTPQARPRDIRNVREEVQFELKQVPRLRRATARRLLSQSGKRPTGKLVAEQTERMEEIEDALLKQGLSYTEIYNLTLEQWLEADTSLTVPEVPSGP